MNPNPLGVRNGFGIARPTAQHVVFCFPYGILWSVMMLWSLFESQGDGDFMEMVSLQVKFCIVHHRYCTKWQQERGGIIYNTRPFGIWITSIYYDMHYLYCLYCYVYTYCIGLTYWRDLGNLFHYVSSLWGQDQSRPTRTTNHLRYLGFGWKRTHHTGRGR